MMTLANAHLLTNTFLFICLCYLPVLRASPRQTPSTIHQHLTISTREVSNFLTSLFPDRQNLDNTLITLDINETLVTHHEDEFLGSSSLFYHLKKLHMEALDIDCVSAIAYIDPLLIEVYRHADIKITDPGTPAAINTLKKQKAIVLGLSCRNPSTNSVILEQLAKLGIQFSDINVQDTLGSVFTVYIIDGLFTTGHSQTKGEALAHLLSLPSFSHIRQVIMLDDQERQLDSAVHYLKLLEQPIDLITVHCIPHLKQPFNAPLAMEQLKTFIILHCHKEPIRQYFQTHQLTLERGKPFDAPTYSCCKFKRNLAAALKLNRKN